MINIISLGAGVQSSCMALMAARGEITPMPDCAIFADTQDEGLSTYQWLGRLRKGLPFPIHAYSRGCLSDALLAGKEEARIPAFVKGRGMVQRQCTRDFKIRVILRATRRVLGVSPRAYIPENSVIQWIGISIDEADRMKPSQVKYIQHRWPLIELGMSRKKCEEYLLKTMGEIAPKSSCVQCPYQSDAQWRRRKEDHPEDFAKACRIDAGLRTPERMSQYHGRELYLHRSCLPLEQVQFADAEDSFSNECVGVCGV